MTTHLPSQKLISQLTLEGKNYESFDFMQTEAISIYERDRIVGFSSIWHRPEYYEPHEVRILNRYWEDPSLRRVSKIIGGPHLIEMVQQQLDWVRQSKYSKVFISREKSPRYFRKLIQAIEEGTDTCWFIEPTKVSVCNPQSESCWQYKAWTIVY